MFVSEEEIRALSIFKKNIDLLRHQKKKERKKIKITFLKNFIWKVAAAAGRGLVAFLEEDHFGVDVVLSVKFQMIQWD